MAVASFSSGQFGDLRSTSVDSRFNDDSSTRPAAGRSPTGSTAHLAPAPTPFSALPGKGSASVTQTVVLDHDGELNERRNVSLWSAIASWKWEWLAAFLAVGVLAAEIALLAYYDGKFLFLHWSHTWQMNTLIAFLSTILETSVMFFVGASIGQLRWHWFKDRQQKLDWLEMMTDSSRPLGAVKLLARKRLQNRYAAAGAVIVIVLLGINTFSQEVITQVIEPFPLGVTSDNVVPINTNYTWDDRDTTVLLGTQQPIPEMVAAIQNGFYSFTLPQSLQSVEAFTSCDGDSCDYGLYQSIAVCSQCEDISNDVNNPCPSGDCTDSDYYTLSNGVDLSLVATTGVVNITSDTNYTTGAALNSSVGPLIVRLNALVKHSGKSNNTGQGASATQCAAWWCVKTYKGSSANGTLHEDVVDEYTDKSIGARTYYGQDKDIKLHPPHCYINNSSPSNASYCTFTASAYTQIALQNFLAGPPNNSLAFTPFLSGSTVHYANNHTWNYTTEVAGALVSHSIATNAVMHEIHLGFQKMADQMTVSIRGALTNSYGLEWSYGSSFWRQEKFHVRWPWIAFPITTIIVALVFFIMTVIITRKDEAWKSSVLPIVFHSFGGVDHEEFVKLDTVKAMQQESRDRDVSLGGGHGHWHFRAGKNVPEKHKWAHRVEEVIGGGVGQAADDANNTFN